MFYGSQDDIPILNSVKSEKGYFDVIVDDGGHTMRQQITSFTYLLPKVRSGGIYVIEDLLTSYIESYGGSYLRNSTTIALIKRLVDDIQTISPYKSTQLVEKISSFEVSNEICFFNIK
jgi:NDP-sugar pyrophosphorylase family protein